jgi:hypothetical protein
MYHGVRWVLPFDPHQWKRLANHPSFNAALHLRSRGQWDGMRTEFACDRFVRILCVFNQREGTPARPPNSFRASVRPITARNAVPPNCEGHIERGISDQGTLENTLRR